MNHSVEIKEYRELAERYHESRLKERFLHIINEFALSLLNLQTDEEIAWTIAKNVIGKMDFEDCVVYYFDPTTNEFVQKAAFGPKNPQDYEIKNPIRIPMGKGIVGTVGFTGNSVIVRDTREDPRYLLDDEIRLSEIAVPIIFEGNVIGVIDSEHPEVGFYTVEHEKILTTIAAMSATRIMHARTQQALRNYQSQLENRVKEQTVALQQTVSELRRSNGDLQRFVYAASHDFKEPLRMIISHLQLLQLKLESLPIDIHENLEFAINGASRMNNLLNGLLSLSKLGDAEEELEWVDLDAIFEAIKKDLGLFIFTQNGVLESQALGKAYGCEPLLFQLFQNLITNGLKFRRDNVRPHITIHAERKPNQLILTFNDNGIGIPRDFFEKIFSLFGRLNNSENYEGSGIGLALCKRIVEFHQGSIEVSSVVGQGTTFTVIMPDPQA